MNEHVIKTIDEYVEKIRLKEEEVRQFKELINRLCEGANLPGRYVLTGMSSSGHSASIRSDQFYGKTVGDAIQEYLEIRKSTGQSAASVNAIFQALKDGGLQSDAKNDENAKRAVKISLTKNPIFHQLPNADWGLRIWYPKEARKLEQDAENAAKPKVHKRRGAKAKTGKESKKSKAAPVAVEAEPESSKGEKFGHSNPEFHGNILKIIDDNIVGNFKRIDLEAAVAKAKPELAKHTSQISFALSGLIKEGKIKVIQKGAGRRPGIYARS